MDPLSVAGLAIGAVSLAFELFSSCVKGYELILEAKDMPKSCRYLLVRFQLEKEKLLSWAVLAKLTEKDSFADAGLRLNRHTVIDTLREIQVLLLDFSKLDETYKLKLIGSTSISNESPDKQSQVKVPCLGDDNSVLQAKALNFVEKTRKYPKRLQWAVFDRGQFEKLLSSLGALNSNMMSFLEAYERKRHFQMQEATFMQILQVNNKIGDLFELMHSLKASTAPHVEGDNKFDKARSQAYEERLISLTRFKAVSIAIENNSQSKDTSDIRMSSLLADAPNESKFAFEKLSQLASDDQERPARSAGLLNAARVWLEWRYYEEGEEDEGPPQFVATRVSKLARLLSDTMKPAEFLVPLCLGIVHDEAQCRYGFIFKSPEALGHQLPVSLLELMSTTKKPSLTTRVRIAHKVATSIWYLHATNWLHKGLRSENVIFQDRDDIRSAIPYLCGFDYSRPANIGEETERPTENLLHDLYRHPNTQFDVPREGRKGFNKLYDIYSLGVLLYEIGVWMPIEKCLDMDTIKASVVKTVKPRLLEADNMDSLESEAGDLFASAARACLNGLSVREESLSSVESDARLQVNFGDQVIKKLELIAA
ncbi:protein kinase, catalytic domain-containingprotein [Fusarium austroafricanum]|uniref:Protein kinase, catalytic domain-containingprotein n=1 Tax=Fusarium austroafricanum TaxID=2364996 RepID=A0A8H4KXD9_9HYPO|nr:protein kinase, catalytic domain-containingprotein [Fusarium austroafricanum]